MSAKKKLLVQIIKGLIPCDLPQLETEAVNHRVSTWRGTQIQRDDHPFLDGRRVLNRKRGPGMEKAENTAVNNCKSKAWSTLEKINCYTYAGKPSSVDIVILTRECFVLFFL